jgi:hypothetical protein
MDTGILGLISWLGVLSALSIENGSGKVTVQQVTSHFIFRCIVLSSGTPGWIW